MTLNRCSILYWPGIRRGPHELHAFFRALRDDDFKIDRITENYDVGLPPDDARSAIQRWVTDPRRVVSHWWIGLSLGAAVAHITACTTPPSCRPKRLTLINPFADRAELSRYLGFSMAGQWRLSPISFPSPGGFVVDVIISRFDERIPAEHGHRLSECYSERDVKIIHLDADHAVSAEGQQRELAAILLST